MADIIAIPRPPAAQFPLSDDTFNPEALADLLDYSLWLILCELDIDHAEGINSDTAAACWLVGLCIERLRRC